MTNEESSDWIKHHLVDFDCVSDGTAQDVAMRLAISALESIAERDLVLVELEHFKKAFKDQIEGKRGVYHCDVCKYGGETYAECLKHECPEDCDGFNHWEWRGAT